MTHRLTDLEDALRALGEHGERIAAFDPAPEDLDDISTGLTRAHRALAAARAVIGRAGCRVHPSAPLDPTTGNACLLCETARRRGQLPEQPTQAPAVPFTDICREVAVHGQEEAVRRYGAPTVARALNRCRNEPDLTEEPAS
ncbi:hypothetical protein ACKI16_29735 [Streptomyces scabiei]|uniref:hypothetical protein n=1 Tax=Streptomyces scabiei TaxID=1930 RepID=UPI0038F5F8D9